MGRWSLGRRLGIGQWWVSVGFAERGGREACSDDGVVGLWAGGCPPLTFALVVGSDTPVCAESGARRMAARGVGEWWTSACVVWRSESVRPGELEGRWVRWVFEGG
ncbi:hypothetical protein GCM10027269_49780 [Kribbella endophytica]